MSGDQLSGVTDRGLKRKGDPSYRRSDGNRFDFFDAVEWNTMTSWMPDASSSSRRCTKPRR
jgi:hypothetical protein